MAEDFEGNPFGAAGCPCCAGRGEGDWAALCDGCAAASLAGRFPHGCRGDARSEPESDEPELWKCPDCGDVMPPGFDEDDHLNCNWGPNLEVSEEER